jgi:hypothetical protein
MFQQGFHGYQDWYGQQCYAAKQPDFNQNAGLALHHVLQGEQGGQGSQQGEVGSLPADWEAVWQPWGGGRAGEVGPAFLPPSPSFLPGPAPTSPLPHEVPATPSPSGPALAPLPSSPHSFDSAFGQEFLQTALPASPSSTSSTSTLPDSLPEEPIFTFPPIQLRNNQSFTEAELKAITPWRNQLLQRLLANRSVPAGQQTPSLGQPARKVVLPKQRPAPVRPGTPLFHDTTDLLEFELGPGSAEYLGRVRRGSTGFLAIQGAIGQANQGAGTVRAVVETVLKFCLPRDLAEYSLTGKSLQEKMEIRNGQAQSRVVMAERGTSKHGVPAELLVGIVRLLELWLTEAGRRSAGPGSLASSARKLVSKTCSRSQERRNQELRAVACRGGRRRGPEQ